jgi:predicted nucleic acid-binding protein
VIAYLETSAAVKLLKDEPDSDAIKRYLNGLVANDDGIASSTLLETELRRAGVRQGIAQSTVTAVLDRIDMFDLSRSTFTQAGVLSGQYLRSLDALHVTAALRINADVMISYDERQKDAAEAAGLRVHSPS